MVSDSPHHGNLFNFSWIEEGIIAGSSKPYYEEQFAFLKNKNIQVIINLTEEPHQLNDLDPFKLYHIPIPDFDVPKSDQIVQFLEICQKHEQASEPVLVHCIAGCGRTGTMLALWLKSKQLVETSEEAIMRIRKMRPCSIETMEQEMTVINFSH